ncbi:MAG: cellulose-binding protein CttA-related protein [Ruminococcus sp.]|nr:cellulose-binding protein CttA-related protein [Ruminococcus sp.]
MKNSLFKRAIATAAAVPLALTQSLTYSFAADTDASVPAATTTAETTSASNSFDLNSLLYIAPAKTSTESEWNLKLDGVIDQLIQDGKTTGDIEIADLAKTAVANAGDVKEIASALLGTISDAKYTINKDGDVVVSAKVGDVSAALSKNFKYSLGKFAADLANKYNAPAFNAIDFSKVVVGGTIEIKIGTSQLGLETKLPVEFTFTPVDGSALGPQATLDYTKEKIAAYKALFDAAADASDGIDKAACKAEIAKNIGKYDDLYGIAQRMLDRVMKFTKTADYSKSGNFAGLLAEANNWAQRRNRTVPASGKALANNATVAKVYDNLKTQLNNAAAPASFDISAADLGAFADTLQNVKLDAAEGKTTLTGSFEDAEADLVKALFESDPALDYDGSYKIFTATLDASSLDEKGVTVEFTVKRIVNTKAKESTTTSSTTTTTTTTTTSTTSSSTTSSSTTSSTSSSTTSTTSTTTTTYLTTTAVATAYAELNATYGFYTNLDEAFAAKQVNGLEIVVIYNTGYTDENGTSHVTSQESQVVDAKMNFSFGDKTPANTYSSTSTDFKYEIPVVYTGEDIKDYAGNTIIASGSVLSLANGQTATVTAYIGLKGDANLDGKVSAIDATYVLSYAADLSGMDGEVKDPQTLRLSKQYAGAEDPSGIYDNFAAFLADVKNDVSPLHAWSLGKGSITDGTSRAFTAQDASAILKFCALVQDGGTPAEAWAQIIK